MITQYKRQIVLYSGEFKEPETMEFGVPLAPRHAFAQVNDWNRAEAITRERAAGSPRRHTCVYWVEG